MTDRTAPIDDAGHSVRAIRVEVVSGPDTGARLVAESDRLTIGTAEGNSVRLIDPTVSRFHLELSSSARGVRARDLGSTNGTRAGAATFVAAEVTVPAGTQLTLGETTLRVDDAHVVMIEEGPGSLGGLRGESPAMRRLLASIERIAASDVGVLVLGESGTGKELVARALHDASSRSTEPFVTVDCAALTPTLFASELFGHERGAFTGADRRHIGAFERADGGTLFLDEIGELIPEQQAALLGALERGVFQRVGGHEDVQAQVRLVSATHRDLRSEVNAGTFRLDLFYRIAVVLLEVPPLRERKSDIRALVSHFLDEAGNPSESLFDDEAIGRLERHSWPGNVRELRNVVLGALALGAPPRLEARRKDVGDPIEGALADAYRDARRSVLDEFERRYVEAQLQRSGGNVRQAARDAKMDRKYLMELMKRHGIRVR